MELTNSIPKLKPRPADAHKGNFGKVCIIAGSIGMSGAAALAGRAALRAGAGLAFGHRRRRLKQLKQDKELA